MSVESPVTVTSTVDLTPDAIAGTTGVSVLNQFVAVEKCKGQQMLALTAIALGDNVRDEASYDVGDLAGSIMRSGFKPNHPLVISRKSDGTCLLLCGNRRHAAVKLIEAQHADQFAKMGLDHLPCIVYEGLTMQEEVILRIDHSPDEDRKPLSGWGEFLAVRQALRCGMDQSAIAVLLGKYTTDKKDPAAGKKPARSWVQPRANLAKLPIPAQLEFKKLWTVGPEATPVRLGDIAKLYAAYNDEYAVYGVNNKIGPKYEKLWDETMGRTEAESRGTKALTVNAATAIGQTAASATMKTLLNALVKEDRSEVPVIDTMMAQMETASRLLGAIERYLGAEAFRELVQKATTADDANVVKVDADTNVAAAEGVAKLFEPAVDHEAVEA